jgi:2-phosphosulfolactate phosphatase
MSESGRPAVFVHLLPGLIAPGALRGGVAVVVDVLRATTVMVHALAAGCASIIPCGEVEEAKAVAASLPVGTALLAGERQGLPIAGFDLGNSPDDFTPESCRGKTLVMTTTNGTRALLASREAQRIGIGAMVNAAAVAGWAASWDRPVHVVCAGTEGEVSLEDTLLAGSIAGKILEYGGFDRGNDATEIARGLFVESSRRFGPPQGHPWSALLAQGRGGRRVSAIGLRKDIEAASRWNVFTIVPVLQRDPLSVVAGPSRRDVPLESSK